MKRRKLFCEISPLTYAISLQKGILARHVKNFLSRVKFASKRTLELLPVVVYAQGGDMIKRGPGIDPQLQQNKADNIRLACNRMNGLMVYPGETFSFWRLVGKTSRRNGFKSGRVIVNGKLVAGTGGGLCNLANTLHLLVLHSPLTVTELHHHSDALAPEVGERKPYSAGTSVSYNFIDYRFRNDTDQPVQICARCDGDILHCELRAEREFPYTYRLVEEDHHFCREANGRYFRRSRIYRETCSRTTGETLECELVWDNRSEVMYDYSLIPKDQIR